MIAGLAVGQRFAAKQRLRGAEVAATLAEGRVLRLPGLVAHVRANAQLRARIAFIVPKRVLRRAVDRNRTRRVLREWFRRHQSEVSGMDIVVRVTAKNAAPEGLAALLRGRA